MRHRLSGRKLGRTTAHREMLLRNLATSLIEKERVRTTVAKAKELRPFVEKLITMGKTGTLAARRRALAVLMKEDAVTRLFETVAPRFSERAGGYTRIVKLGPRKGDGAEMAVIELVGSEFKAKEKKKKDKEKSKKPAKA
ncbi:MAG TPA: 50S ribosomal protein L17 [Candidatus Aminicenantes bacterium]|nr:50S ribosomal protein L17 [Candidatus Aminicenantes bacterium]